VPLRPFQKCKNGEKKSVGKKKVLSKIKDVRVTRKHCEEDIIRSSIIFKVWQGICVTEKALNLEVKDFANGTWV
jgi:hypothetical protein